MRPSFFFAASLTLLLTGRPARAQTFPADGAWLPLTGSGVEIRDANGDVSLSGGRDVVGASPVDQPSVLVAADATYLFFRLRLDVQPTASNGIWGCEIDVDGSPGVYEYFVGYFAGASATVRVQTWFNSLRGANPSAIATTFLAGHSSATHSSIKQTTVGPLNWWISWAIPRADFNRPGFVLTTTTALRLTGGIVSDGNAHLVSSASGDIAGDGSPSDSLVCGDAGCNAAVVGVEGRSSPALHPGLVAIEPNPARGSTVIRFGLLRESEVSLDVLDLQGRRVATVARGRSGPGIHAATWSGRDDRGRPVPAGSYFVRLSAGGELSQRSVVVLR